MESLVNRFAQNVGRLNMAIDVEKVNYFLRMMYPTMEQYVDQVLNDSETDPEYSAVAASNVIKCYIQIMTDLDNAPSFNDVESFFKINGYSDEEYQRFEECRKRESQYYIGTQY